MPPWIPYVFAALFLVISAFVKSLSRSGPLEVTLSDCNFGTQAALGTALLVANSLIGNPQALSNPAYVEKLGYASVVAFCAFVLSLFLSRKIDEARQQDAFGNRLQASLIRVAALVGTSVLSVICLAVSVSLK